MQNNHFTLTDHTAANFQSTTYSRLVACTYTSEEANQIVEQALLSERKRISRELHDNVNQILTTVKLFTELLQPARVRDSKLKGKTLDYVMMAINEIRKISKELVDTKSTEENLDVSIRRIIEDIQMCTPIVIVFKYNGAIENIQPDKKIALLRIIQEQIKNIVSYSHAEKVQITMDIVKDKVNMEISDNGIGFDSHLASNGRGLANINERTQQFMGTVVLKTAKGKGCTLQVVLPAA